MFDNFLTFCLLCFFGPFFIGIALLLIDGREGRQRANLEQKIQERILEQKERILEQKRELNKKRIIEAEKRAAIHKSLRPSREELERKRQEELIEENRKRLASKQPEDDSELAKLRRLKEDWLEDKIE